MADSGADADNITAAEQPVTECLSCRVISDCLPFACAAYMVYHTVKHRRTLTGWQRTKLYIVNGLFTASKCFLSLFTNLSESPVSQ